MSEREEKGEVPCPSDHEHVPVRDHGVVRCSRCGAVLNDWQEQNENER